MAIKKYVADRDTAISNAYTSGMLTRLTGSGEGESDTLSVFSIYGQQDSGSSELSRALYRFSTSDISTDRTNGDIPASGSCNFFINLYNVKHNFTLPKKFTLVIAPVSRSWDEGNGINSLDSDSPIESYCNWEKASSGSNGVVSWFSEGGDYLASPRYTQYFDKGDEDLEIDITTLVEQWLDASITNYGVGVFLTSSIETATSSSYIKKFFARGSEFFFKRPTIEARWDDSIRDDRAKFYASSSLYTATDNTNTIYLYNYARGALANIPDATSGIYLNLFDDAQSGSQLTTTTITGGLTSTTGIYSASVALATTSSYIFDRWYVSSSVGITYVHTGSIVVEPVLASNSNQLSKYVTSIPNLKSNYSNEEEARIRTFVRAKDWCPSIYVKANNTVQSEIIDDSYYKVYRVADNLDVIQYGTGSTNHTRMSRDVSGSYFDLDMSLLEPGYMYGIKFVYKLDNKYREQKETFKFRVEE